MVEYKKGNVVGISVGTQLMGLACVHDGNLMDWRLKHFDGAWSKMKLRIIELAIERYVLENRIDSVVLKVPDERKSSDAVRLLTQALVLMCDKNGIHVTLCSVEDLKARWDASNKEQLITCAIKLYPRQLIADYHRHLKVKRVSYTRMFEAVLAARLM